MQISVRSYLTAGTVAVVGVGAIALTPPLPAAVNLSAVPAPVLAEFTLTAANLSLDQIIALLNKLGLGDVLSPVLNLLPTNLVNAFTSELSKEALALITTAANGIVSDLGAIVTGLIAGPDSILHAVGTAIGNVPKAVIAAVQALGKDGASAALQQLVAAFTGPLSGVGQLITDAAKAFEAQLTQRIGNLVNAIPDLLVNVVQAVVANDFQALVGMVKNALSGISKLFGGVLPFAGVHAAAAVAPAAAPAVRISAAAALPVAEVPTSAAVAPRSASRSGHVVAQGRSISVAPKPTAATASAPASAATAAPTVPDQLPAAAAPRSKSTAHPRAAASRPVRAAGAPGVAG